MPTLAVGMSFLAVQNRAIIIRPKSPLSVAVRPGGVQLAGGSDRTDASACKRNATRPDCRSDSGIKSNQPMYVIRDLAKVMPYCLHTA